MTGEYQLGAHESLLMGWYLMNQPAWLHRKVEQATFPRPRTLYRSVSVDFTWDPERTAVELGLQTEASWRLPVPLALLAKQTLRGFSLRDEGGRSVPVLTTAQNAAVSTAVLTAWFARGLLGMTEEEAQDLPAQRLLGAVVRGPTRAVREGVDRLMAGGELMPRLVRLLQHGPAPEQAAADAAALIQPFHYFLSVPGGTDPDRRAYGQWLLRRFAVAFVLYVDMASGDPENERHPVSGRRVLKFGYETEAEMRAGQSPTAHASPADAGTPFPGFRRHYSLGEHVGIRAASCHTELVPPENLHVVPEGTVLLGSERLPLRIHDNTGHQGRAHLHYGEEYLPIDEPVATGHVLQPVRDRGIVRRSQLAAGWSAVALAVLACLSAARGWGLTEADSEGQAAVPLLLLLPGLFAGYAAARSGEHALTFKLLRAARLALIGVVLTWVAAAAPVAFDDQLTSGDARLDLWHWWLLCASVTLALALYVSLPRRWPAGWTKMRVRVVAVALAVLSGAAYGAMWWRLIEWRFWERLVL